MLGLISKTCLLHVCDKHAPFKKVRIKNRFSPWISTELTDLIRLKHSLWHKAKASKMVSDWQTFRQVRNKCTQSIRKSKSEYYKNQFLKSSSDPQKFWQTVKNLENKNTSAHLR